MAIGQSYKTNFDTLRAAAENNDLCLLEVYDRITGEPAVMLCAGFIDENEEVHLVPLAQMCDYNPYEKFVTETEDVARYQGIIKGDGTRDVVCLHPWEEIFSSNHYSYNAGFNWGDGSASAAQLAFSLLEYHLKDHERAKRLHQQFKREVISQLPKDQGWSMSAKELDSWIHHAEHPEEEQEKADGTTEEVEAPSAGETPPDGA